jgi:hypothetical protein
MRKLSVFPLCLLALGAAIPAQKAIEALDSNDPMERARATCPLSSMKEEAVAALGDPAPSVREKAAWVRSRLE